MGTITKKEYNIREEIKVSFLKKVTSVLNENDTDYWIEYGTLLGFLRDKSLIPWDHDVDLVVLNFEKVLDLIPQFEKMNLQIRLRWEKTKFNTRLLQIYDPNIKNSPFHIDIYEFTLINGKPTRKETFKNNYLAKFLDVLKKNMNDNNLNFSYVNNFLDNLTEFFSLKRTLIFPETETELSDFYNMKIKIPTNPEEHVEFLYGEDWRIPNKNHKNIESGTTKHRKRNIWVCEWNKS